MERSNRPYLPQQNDTVTKFLRGTNQLTSPYLPGTSSTLITRFPTDADEHKFSNVSSKYSSSSSGTHNNTNAQNSDSPFSSSQYNTYSSDRKRSSGLSSRTPLYNSIRKNSNTPSSIIGEYRYAPDRSATIGGYNKQKEDYNNFNQQQQQFRQIPVQIKDEAKKSKSALKSIRSFFKKHLVGRRDYSTPTPVSKRFASTLEINGSLPPYATPIAHRRSTSTSSTTGLPRPQSTFSLSRATGRPLTTTQKLASATFTPSINDKIYKNMTPSINSSIEDVTQKMTNSSIADYSSTNGLAWKSKETPTKQSQSTNEFNNQKPLGSIPPTVGSVQTQPTSYNFANSTRHTKQLSQPRPSTGDVTSSAEANTIPAREVNKILQSTADIPCLKGLTNHGNTCYFSAIMQCLTNCDRFAENFVCKETDESEKNTESLSKALANTLRCLWFNNHLADSSCLKTLQLIGKEKPQFVISHQQDSHECLIWLLDKLHEEIKEDEFRSKNKVIPSLRTHKSEGELAIDALERISGGKSSTIMDIFRGQFRSAIECTSPVCGFSNLTFDPYLTVSLSIPLPKRAREISVIFVPFFSARQIVRYHFSISETNLTVNSIKERIMKTMNGLPEETIACNILTNGQSQFLPNDAQIDDRIKEFILMEMPKLNEQQQLQDLVVAIVVFVVGIVPDGERYGFPYIAVLNRQWSYDRICKFLLDKGSFLLPRAFYPLPSDYTLLIQHSTETVACLDPMMGKPLFHDCVNKVLDENSNEKVLKLIVEWSSSVRHEFNRAPTESVANDYSFLRDRSQVEVAREYVDQQIPIPLVNLIEDYVKTETIQDWKCPKCGKSPGRKELKFHSLPDVLIFHLNRFELLNNGITKKIDTRVQVPIDGLDLTPYVFNPDLRASTLPKHRKDRNAFDNILHDGTMLYDLIGIVYHYGERTNSGHYTAATRNPMDGQWRTFDDSRVSLPIDAGGEIRMSTKSYLLFYERRKQGRSVANWFPQKVPERIVAKYSKKASESIGDDGTGQIPIMRGSSRFYTGTLMDDNNIQNEKERSESMSLLPERRVPITRLDDDIRINTSPYTYSLPRSSTRSASTTPYSSTYLASSNHQIYPSTRYSAHRF